MHRTTTVSLFVVALPIAAAAVLLLHQPATRAHCQVPCGIYDDKARIAQLNEDAATVEKAINSIRDLAGKHDANAFNQAARWVATKEQHGSHIITVVAEYFLTQKVKPVEKGAAEYDGYLAKLADHHAVMRAAMKCKQSAKVETIGALRGAIERLAAHY